VAALLTAATIVLSSQSNAAASAPCSDENPIVVGDVSSLSGALRFPESQQAAKLAFDALNLQCGIKGRRIDYQVLDDAGEPDKARALTAQLVDRGAVALVGGTSVVSCGVNAELYATAPIASIPGTGTGPRCFDSTNISPPNSGLFSIVTLALKFAEHYLHPKMLCVIGNAHPSIPGNFQVPVEHFQRMSGKPATIVNQELHPDSDPNAVLAQLQQAGCDVAFVGTLGQFAARTSAALAKSTQGRLKLIFAPEAYTTEFAAQLDPALSGRIYVVTDTDFFDSDKPGMRRARSRLENGGVELSPFAVSGELAAQILIDALRRVRGPLSRQTLLAALIQMGPYDTQGLTASPYKFAWPESGRYPSGVHVAVFKDRSWRHATDNWITLPPRGARD
jgi:branched-chain amino acid transport system substrate-binding protein